MDSMVLGASVFKITKCSSDSDGPQSPLPTDPSWRATQVNVSFGCDYPAMVYVNSKKFACESCIKGHRSSSCHHTDRPLFEIKKKGRPVSQCNKCRELRQSKRVHSKCTCDDNPPRGEPSRALPGIKSRRFIPITPALPNGLKDVLQSSIISSSTPADARQRVDSLLNPCNCKSVWKCKCRTIPTSSSETQSGSSTGLETLAHAAALCCSSASTSTSPPVVEKPIKRKTARPGSPNLASHKRPKHGAKVVISPLPGPELPPIHIDTSSSSQIVHPIPDFPTMPPMSTIASLAGSGCTCGFQCACPGCVEHRGAKYASKERKDCADGCGTCVDHISGIALPSSSADSNIDADNTTNFLDKFFARAAALPPPPVNRRMNGSIELDPMNMTVYPSTARATGESAFAFGLVNLPKLECCGGECACPNGRCGCGKSCNGCCADHRDDNPENSTPIQKPSSVARESAIPESPGSCCAAKKITAVTV